MRTITLKRLTLDNFKCHQHLELPFDGRCASIYGDNATGKSSIYDAFCWLLFGKDSLGQSDEKAFCVKPLGANGEVRSHEAITSVKAELAVDGEELTLERTLREIWTTRRGSAEAVYSGNTSDYFVNDVPCKKNEFDKRIHALVSEDTFRLLTDLRFFCEKSRWQDRRKLLFEISGVMSDQEIMATQASFQPLAQAMGRLSVEEITKQLAARKRDLAGSRDEIPARIDELQRQAAALAQLDFDAADTERQRLEAEQERLSAALTAIDHNQAAEAKQLEISEIRLKLQQLQAANEAYRTSQMQAVPDISTVEAELGAAQSQKDRLQQQVNACRERIEYLDGRIEACRNDWKTANSRSFSGGTCPTCGQRLPDTALKTAQEKFQQEKTRQLENYVRDADAAKESKAAEVTRLFDLEAEVEDTAARLDALRTKLSETRDAAKGITVQDLGGYLEKTTALQKLLELRNEEYQTLLHAPDTERRRLREALADVSQRLRGQMQVLAKKGLLEESKRRTEELREQARRIAAELEQVCMLQNLLEEFSRYKAGFVEAGINSRFRLAAFRLFRQQANGGTAECCDVMHNGVPYSSLNNGMRINIGVDIVNTLAEHYGVKIPLFVDNAESVTMLEPSDMQVIRLVVSEQDKELRCEYEN